MFSLCSCGALLFPVGVMFSCEKKNFRTNRIDKKQIAGIAAEIKVTNIRNIVPLIFRIVHDVSPIRANVLPILCLLGVDLPATFSAITTISYSESGDRSVINNSRISLPTLISLTSVVSVSKQLTTKCSGAFSLEPVTCSHPTKKNSMKALSIGIRTKD